MSSIGSYSAQNGLDAGLCGTRGGESIWVLVLVGVANDQASMSSRISETSNGSGVLGSARGTTIESGLRNEARDTTYVGVIGSFRGSRVAAGTAGLGGARREGGGAMGRGEGRGGGGGRDLDRGKVGSIWKLGPVVGGRSGRGLLILLRPVGRSVPVLELRVGGRRESRRAGLFEGTRGEERQTTWPNSREYHNTSSSSSSSNSPSDSSSSGPSWKNDSNVNSSVSEGLASEIERDGIDVE
jgi:hypothetical protein